MGRLILHLADLHLGFEHTYLGADREERAREADGSLDRVAAWLTGSAAPDVGAVLIAGDLFDDPRPADAAVERAIRALRRILDSGIAVATVPGNHDEWTYPDGVFRRWRTVWPGILATSAEPERIATLDLDGLGVELISCAYDQGHNPPSSQWNGPLPPSGDPGTRRIGLFHGTLDRIRGKVASGERAFLLDFDRLAGWGLDYLALGHIHKRDQFMSGRCLAHYPGPIEGKEFTDPGSPSLSLIDLRGPTPVLESVDSRTLGIRSREVGSRPIDLVGIADAAHLEREIASLSDAEAAPPILRIVLRGRPSFRLPLEEIRRSLAPRFLRLDIVAEEPAIDLGDWESLAAQRTLEGVFVSKVLERRSAAPPEEARRWALVAEAGLRALGRSGS